MRQLFAILVSLFSSHLTFAQEPFYKEMMDDNSYNFYDVVDSANAWFETHESGKGSGFKPFQRWVNENESKFYPSGDRLNAYYHGAMEAHKVLKSELKQMAHKAELSEWEELGPWDANNITSHYSPGIGRVETFWVNPSNTDEIMIGSRSGGFWKTTDGGKNWFCSTDTLYVTGVQSIAVNPFNSKDVLISIRQGGNSNTHGIYRSFDGGITWNQTAFNPSNTGLGGLGKSNQIHKIAFHPTRKEMIFIGTNVGLFVSKNNLNESTWKSSISGNIRDIEFHPTKAEIMYAYDHSGNDRDLLKVSRDTGATFNNSAALNGNDKARCFIAVTPQQPKDVYLASSKGVWQSRNEGLFFIKLSNPDESCQGFAISDKDEDIMLYGYVDTEVSTDGGNTFEQVTWWSNRNEAYVHADIRAAECLDGVFYLGTDGYLAKSSDNGKTWTRLNDGTAIREFYAVGLGQSNIDQHMAGSQDNGTSILNSEGWVEWNGGDGMEALVHPLNNDMMIGSWQYGSRNWTNNGGLTRVRSNNPENGSGKANWEAPLLMDPENHNTVYHFANEIYRSLDFGATWDLFSEPNIGIIQEAAISELTSEVMVVFRPYNNGGDLRITEDGGKTWKSIRSGLPNNSITDIEFDPRDDSTIVVTYNRYQSNIPKIYVSHDQGDSWSDITFNLNDMPLRSVVIDHTEDRNIYVGGEIGVYYMEMGGDTWKLLGEELPNVTVKDLEINYGANTIKAATWGRGLWQHRLPNREDAPRILTTRISQTPSDMDPKESNDQVVTCEIESKSKISSAEVHYSINSMDLDQKISMSNSSGDAWVSDAGIPSPKTGDKIYFKVLVEAANGGKAESFRFFYELTPFVYCNAYGAPNTTSSWIKYLKLDEFENTSNKADYSDFTHSDIILTEGETYTLSVQLDRSFDPDSAGAWIDFNINRSFEESEALNMSAYDGTHTATGTFTVLSDAVFYEKVIMRVRNSFGEAPDPCGEAIGEVEDYGIILHHSKSSGIADPGETMFSLYPNPNVSAFNLELDENYTSISVAIYSIAGEKLIERSYENKASVSFEHNLNPGTYLVKVITDSCEGSRRFVVQSED